MIDAEQLAAATAEEFAASLPTDEAGWLEAAKRIAERVESTGRELGCGASDLRLGG